MSLINDALKKAKQAQATAPVRESAPQLRSPETDHPVRSGPSFLLPAVIVAFGLACAAVVWIAMSGRSPHVGNVEPVAAAGRPSSAPTAGPAQAPAVREAAPALTVVIPPAATRPEPGPAVVPPPPTTDPAPSAPATVPSHAPAWPKLNGIFFNPTRPTAIVNNKLVSAGSRVGAFTVLAITQNSVTLAGGGQTNVLSLSE